MALFEKMLGQLRENSTSAAAVYTNPSARRSVIRTICVANTSGGAATVRIFIDDDGTTYDESTAIAWDVSIAAGERLEISGFYVITGGGNIAYRSSVANALTISVFGAELS